MKDKLSLLSSSLKTRGCFFCLAAFVFLAFFLTSPAFARQSLEYNTVTGLWDYSTKDALSSFSARQVVGYNPVTGLWH